jgi:hypothetical protein
MTEKDGNLLRQLKSVSNTLGILCNIKHELEVYMCRGT